MMIFFKNNFKLLMEITSNNKNFKIILFKVTSLNKKSKLKSQYDKFADLLHIEDVNGQKFFSE